LAENPFLALMTPYRFPFDGSKDYMFRSKTVASSIITRNGQVVIPAKIRRHLGLKTGTRIYFYEENGEVRIVPVTPEVIERNFGIFKDMKGKLKKALMEEKKHSKGT
jgi:AbrB family looped-hinge helix DNA binding protein